jgi:hypothetical protein
MKWLLIAMVILLPSIAQAKVHHHKHHHGYRHTLHHKASFHSHHRRHYHRHYHSSMVIKSNPIGPIETIQTAVGIPITVAVSLAEKFKGFIADLKENYGYMPKHIGCYASGGHVTHSRHYVGAACDFDQRGWGLTADTMHHVSALAHKYGLRDGCDFGDCGHIDDGRIGVQIVSKHWPLRYDEIRKEATAQ